MLISDKDALIAAKHNDSAAARFSITIGSEDGTSIGRLVCVDRGLTTDDRIVAELTDWRQQYMQFFLTQFIATPERTRNWLVKSVLPAADRILFLIEDAAGHYIGNFGVAAIRPGAAELDNLIRGRNTETKGIVYRAELAMLNWIFSDPSMQHVDLHVFSHNAPTIKLHSRVGFTKDRSHALTEVKTDLETSYLVDQNIGAPVGFTYDRMVIDREKFYDINLKMLPSLTS